MRSRPHARGGCDTGSEIVRWQHGRSAADLNIAEQFVLWALRTRLEGAAKRDRLEEGFRLAQGGASGSAALAAFEPWFGVVASHCCRDLYLHRTPRPCLSGDERALVDLVASAQAGDEARLHHVAATLVHPRAIGLLLSASRTFAGALCLLGLHLSGGGAQPGRSAAANLH
jgi:hypothetical protein